MLLRHNFCMDYQLGTILWIEDMWMAMSGWVEAVRNSPKIISAYGPSSPFMECIESAIDHGMNGIFIQEEFFSIVVPVRFPVSQYSKNYPEPHEDQPRTRLVFFPTSNSDLHDDARGR